MKNIESEEQDGTYHKFIISYQHIIMTNNIVTILKIHVLRICVCVLKMFNSKKRYKFHSVPLFYGFYFGYQCTYFQN